MITTPRSLGQNLLGEHFLVEVLVRSLAVLVVLSEGE